MKFKVTGISNIVCCGCSGTTNVAPKNTYNTDDLTCNCESSDEAMKFEVTHLTDIVDIHSNESTRVVTDGVYQLDEDGGIQEIQNEDITMFDEPYHEFVKTASIEAIGQDEDGNVLVQNTGDSSDRWIIPSDVFAETYEAVEGIEPIDANDAVGTDDENGTKKVAKQTQMFVESPENVIDPAESNMDEAQVREYLKSLGWQELLEAAKNNEVVKPPTAKREELEEMIIQKVFHE